MKYRGRFVVSIAFLAAAFVLTLAGATLLYAQSEIGNYVQQNLGAVVQPSQNLPAPGAKYSVGNYPLYWPELEPGEGVELVTSYCNACHSPRYILMQPPLSRDQWAAEVTKMVKTFGIQIPEEDQPRIVNYLATHYSPETRKK
ncbi:MAG TPA: sulfide dehydrogenase [Patescibacteria group bacterium]|nr:sulfide dehydrogenase [Patescibacteria group bacterium]